MSRIGKAASSRLLLAIGRALRSSVETKSPFSQSEEGLFLRLFVVYQTKRITSNWAETMRRNIDSGLTAAYETFGLSFLKAPHE